MMLSTENRSWVTARGNRTFVLLILATLFTLLNAIKPLHIDDAYYHAFAANIAQRPLDPYGFQLFWWQQPQAADKALAPPVFIYWWGLGIRLLGEQPFLWKMWAGIFSLIFTFSLDSLFRRFVPRLSLPLVWMTVLSPVFLPSFNLMVDVPALALSLAALAVFFRAVDRDSFIQALLAGLIAGAAMQTKYTALVVPAVFFAYGLTRMVRSGDRATTVRVLRPGDRATTSSDYALVRSKVRLCVAAGLLAVLIFIGWEWWVACLYGESHFLLNVRQQTGSPWAKLAMLSLPLVTLAGGAAPVLLILGLAALRAPRWVLSLGAMAIILGFALLAFVPENQAVLMRHTVTHKPRLTLNNLVFGALGWGVWGTFVLAAGKLCRIRVTWNWPSLNIFQTPPVRDTNRMGTALDWFLVAWLGLEIASYFTISPFPAVRRIMGIMVVITLLVGRLASRTCRSPEQMHRVRRVALGGVGLGLMFYAIDLREALAEKQAIAKVMKNPSPNATTWYVGHWGLQYYAEAAGMVSVIPGRSVLRAGDWLVAPDSQINQQNIVMDHDNLVPLDEIRVSDAIPLRTVACYYGGRAALEHRDGPRVSLTLYRVAAPWVPASPR